MSARELCRGMARSTRLARSLIRFATSLLYRRRNRSEILMLRRGAEGNPPG